MRQFLDYHSKGIVFYGKEWNLATHDYIAKVLDKAGRRIQFFDDYLSEQFLFEGYAYYPLAVLERGKAKPHWIRWRTDVLEPPYVLAKDAVIENAAETVPLAFVERLSKRQWWFDRKHTLPILYCYDLERKEWTNEENRYYFKYEYCRDKHIEQRLLEDIAQQVTDYLKAFVKREGWMKNYYHIKLDHRLIFFEKDEYWYFQISVVDGNARGVSTWVRSKTTFGGPATQMRIEVCESVDEEILRRAEARARYSYTDENGKKILSATPLPGFIPVRLTQAPPSRIIKHIETKGEGERM